MVAPEGLRVSPATSLVIMVNSPVSDIAECRVWQFLGQGTGLHPGIHGRCQRKQRKDGQEGQTRMRGFGEVRRPRPLGVAQGVMRDVRMPVQMPDQSGIVLIVTNEGCLAQQFVRPVSGKASAFCALAHIFRLQEPGSVSRVASLGILPIPLQAGNGFRRVF